MEQYSPACINQLETKNLVTYQTTVKNKSPNRYGWLFCTAIDALLDDCFSLSSRRYSTPWLKMHLKDVTPVSVNGRWETPEPFHAQFSIRLLQITDHVPENSKPIKREADLLWLNITIDTTHHDELDVHRTSLVADCLKNRKCEISSDIDVYKNTWRQRKRTTNVKWATSFSCPSSSSVISSHQIDLWQQSNQSVFTIDSQLQNAMLLVTRIMHSRSDPSHDTLT